jgi:hypothetical protein
MRRCQIAVSLALVIFTGANACSSQMRSADDEPDSRGGSGSGGKSSGSGGRGGSGSAGDMNEGGAGGGGDPGAGGAAATGGAGSGEDAADAGAGEADGPADDGGSAPPAECSALCPALFALASACAPDDMCTAATSMSGMTKTERLCHGNGIKQVVDTKEDEDTGDFTQTVKVLKGDGTTCYTIDVTGNDDGDTMTWKAPDGSMVATGKLNDDGTTITCNGATKEVDGDAACPWVYEGPDEGDCQDGTCN